jgi:hypothetical protein
MHIPIPEGLQLPPDANAKPFKLNGLFLAVGDKLMPLELDGKPVAMPEHEEEEGGEYGGGCEKCGGKGEMHGQEGSKGNSFVVAIERSMKR